MGLATNFSIGSTLKLIYIDKANIFTPNQFQKQQEYTQYSYILNKVGNG